MRVRQVQVTPVGTQRWRALPRCSTVRPEPDAEVFFVDRRQRILAVSVLGLMTSALAVAVAIAVAHGSGAPVAPVMIALAFVAGFWRYLLWAVPREIAVHRDGRIELRSVFRTRSLSVQSISEVKLRAGFLDVWVGGLHQQWRMADVAACARRLVELNPRIVVRGRPIPAPDPARDAAAKRRARWMIGPFVVCIASGIGGAIPEHRNGSSAGVWQWGFLAGWLGMATVMGWNAWRERH